MSIDRYTLEVIDSFPTPLQPGVLYVSTKFSTAAHLCACGCGFEVVTKLSPARYRVAFDGEVSLAPSVAAAGLPCRSHYFVTRGAVDWHRRLDAQQTQRGRARDQLAIEAHRAAVQAGWATRLRRRVRGLLGRR